MRICDKTEIRRRLNAEREWSLYALADLDDELFAQCEWWAVEGGLALVFRGIAIRPIFVMGDAASTRTLLHALPEPDGYLNLRADQVDAAAGIYDYRERHDMRRMILEGFRPRQGATEPLGPEHCGEIERLYASGAGGGVAFAPFQLRTGLFRGIRREGLPGRGRGRAGGLASGRRRGHREHLHAPGFSRAGIGANGHLRGGCGGEDGGNPHHRLERREQERARHPCL